MLTTSRNALMLLTLAPAALCGTACMHGTSKPKQLSAGEEVRVEGKLSQAEFGCLTVLTTDGRRFSIARDIEGSHPGQSVWIEGYVVKTKGCQPGLTLMPRHAGLLQDTAVTAVQAGTGR